MAEFIESSYVYKTASSQECVQSGREYIVQSTSAVCTYVGTLTDGLGNVLVEQVSSAEALVLSMGVRLANYACLWACLFLPGIRDCFASSSFTIGGKQHSFLI